MFCAYLPWRGRQVVDFILGETDGCLSICLRKVQTEVWRARARAFDAGVRQVVDFIQAEIDGRLLGANCSRVFYTQTLLPGACVCVCVRARVCVSACLRAHACVRARVLRKSACARRV